MGGGGVKYQGPLSSTVPQNSGHFQVFLVPLCSRKPLSIDFSFAGLSENGEILF